MIITKEDIFEFLVDKYSDFTLCIERNKSTNTISYESGLTLEVSDSELDKFITDDFILLE